MKVYLAGGIKNLWREIVKEKVNCIYFEPKNDMVDPASYTLYDLTAIEKCDVLFGFMEKDNLSGIGLALEIGYAKALCKPIILVNESDNKHFAIVEQSSGVVFKKLNDGLELLQQMSSFYDFITEKK